MNISEKIELHRKWLRGESDGVKADLRRADLSGADLRRADLSGADLRRADLSDADLSGADLSGADLRRADLSGADLSGADLRRADLRRADLSDADLSDADLSGADLSGADLSGADLRRADLSGAKGLLSAIDFLKEHFEMTNEGFIAYKTFGSEYNPPEKWVIQPGSVITENVNFDTTNTCGCGINVAPLKWVQNVYGGDDIWKVLIRFEWLAGVCVPYNSDGKIRCERVQLLEIVEED